MSTISLIRNNFDRKSMRKTKTDQAIVIDIDETLVRSYSDLTPLKKLDVFAPANRDVSRRIYTIELVDVVGKKGEGSVINMWSLKRPYVEDFLLYCFHRFRIVAVWSAGNEKYVEAMCDKLFSRIEAPDLIFTRGNCVANSAGHQKPLEKMFDLIGRDIMNEKNTFIIDDKTVAFSEDPQNGILMPEFAPSEHSLATLRSDDPTLQQLKYWFSLPEVVNATDVRTLDKSNIFSVPLSQYSGML
jgi:TFIIF-interacting CTD phosphatase-like protein